MVNPEDIEHEAMRVGEQQNHICLGFSMPERDERLAREAVQARVDATMQSVLHGLCTHQGMQQGQERDVCIRAYRYAICMEFVRAHVLDTVGKQHDTTYPTIDQLHDYIMDPDLDLMGELEELG